MSPRGSLIEQIDQTVEKMRAQDNAAELIWQVGVLESVGALIAAGEDDAAVTEAERLLGGLEEKGWLAELPGWIKALRLVELADGGGGVARTVGDRGQVVVDGQARMRAMEGGA